MGWLLRELPPIEAREGRWRPNGGRRRPSATYWCVALSRCCTLKMPPWHKLQLNARVGQPLLLFGQGARILGAGARGTRLLAASNRQPCRAPLPLSRPHQAAVANMGWPSTGRPSRYTSSCRGHRTASISLSMSTTTSPWAAQLRTEHRRRGASAPMRRASRSRFSLGNTSRSNGAASSVRRSAADDHAAMT